MAIIKHTFTHYWDYHGEQEWNPDEPTDKENSLN